MAKARKITPNKTDEIANKLRDTELITRAVTRAVADARRTNKTIQQTRVVASKQTAKAVR